jgi:hypothetical protein
MPPSQPIPLRGKEQVLPRLSGELEGTFPKSFLDYALDVKIPIQFKRGFSENTAILLLTNQVDISLFCEQSAIAYPIETMDKIDRMDTRTLFLLIL